MTTGECLVYTQYIGFGDILYHTPLLRMLDSIYDGVDVWCFNPEPLLNNPHVRNLYQKQGDYAPNPMDFYFHSVFYISKDYNQYYEDLYIHNFHSVDFFTTGTVHLQLRPHEKELELNWTKKDENVVFGLLKNHSEIKYAWLNNLVVVNPSIGWPSRTLSLEFYKEIIARIQENGDVVILVGKEIHPTDVVPDQHKDMEELKKYEVKGMYPSSEFPGAIDLVNKLTLHECAYLYSIAKLAVNSENGNMVISTCNNSCWNLYIPTLTAPEYRLPFRRGRQDYRTLVIGNSKNYYPGSDYANLRKGQRLYDAPAIFPTVDEVYQGYLEICEQGKTRILK